MKVNLKKVIKCFNYIFMLFIVTGIILISSRALVEDYYIADIRNMAYEMVALEKYGYLDKKVSNIYSNDDTFSYIVQFYNNKYKLKSTLDKKVLLETDKTYFAGIKDKLYKSYRIVDKKGDTYDTVIIKLNKGYVLCAKLDVEKNRSLNKISFGIWIGFIFASILIVFENVLIDNFLIKSKSKNIVGFNIKNKEEEK